MLLYLILNWNGKELLEECIDSVLQSTYAPLEIILIDNGSVDGSLELVKTKYPAVIILENGKNIGFAQGNNKGVEISNGKYFVTLNNDVVVEPAWLERPLEYLESDDCIGIVGCRQMNYFNRSLVDSYFHYPSPGLIFERLGNGKPYDAKSFFAIPGYVISVNGGSAIVRKDLFLRLGGFDNNFFAYHDETDFCMRIFLNGFKCVYSPQSVVYHKDGASFKKATSTRLFCIDRNTIWFIFKYYPLSIILKSIVPILKNELSSLKHNFFLGSNPGLYLKAKWQGLFGMPKYLQCRKEYTNKFIKRRKEFVLYQQRLKIPFSNLSKATCRSFTSQSDN